jgi:hypothetical protein
MEVRPKKGDRVRFSPEGLRWLGVRQRLGTVVGDSKGGCIRVLWDDRKTDSPYSVKFIEQWP